MKLKPLLKASHARNLAKTHKFWNFTLIFLSALFEIHLSLLLKIINGFF